MGAVYERPLVERDEEEGGNFRILERERVLFLEEDVDFFLSDALLEF